MSNADRKEARYQRSKAKRELKKFAHNAPFDLFEQLTNIDHLFISFLGAKKNVSWKESVQKYGINVFRKLIAARRALIEGMDVRKGFVEFFIRERGKVRQIKSVHIEERVVQKCLCDYVLLPILGRSLIYDNGASLRGKGMSFSENRLKRHLREFYKENGSNDGYVLTIDFSKYFDNVSHEILIGRINEKITDLDLRRVILLFIAAFDDKVAGYGKSLGLGSQISQLCAIYYPNKLDHFAKENLRIKGYGRYMDDIYLIHKDKAYLKYCLAELQKVCAELKISMNLKKTHINKLSDGVAFLKGRYMLLSTGRVLARPLNNNATIRMKRKLKKLAKKTAHGAIHYWGVFQTYYSWRQNFLKRFSAYYRIQSVDAVFWESMKEYHTSYDNPPLLNTEPIPLYPFGKIGLLDEDREDVCAALALRSNNYFRENEAGYLYAGGFIKS